MNNVFKVALLVVAMGILVVLYGIYQKLDKGRYQPVDSNGFGIMLDTKTNEFYSIHEGKWQKMKVDGYTVNAKSLPQ